MATKKYSVTLSDIRVQTGTENLLYVTWTFDQTKAGHFDHYEVQWFYRVDAVGSGQWFQESPKDIKIKQDTWTPPNNAVEVKVNVKPVSDTKEEKKNGKKIKVSYWKGVVAYKTYTIDSTIRIEAPSAPNVEITNTTLTATVNYTNNLYPVDKLIFEVVKNNTTRVAQQEVLLAFSTATLKLTVDAGSTYKVRARAVSTVKARGMASISIDPRGLIYSDWSEYSSDASTVPGRANWVSLESKSETSVVVTWSEVSSADEYEIQYTTDPTYFDTSSSEVQSDTMPAVSTTRNINVSEGGIPWYFRIRAINDAGEGPWSSIANVTIGATPGIPTTWSYTTTAKIGDPITFNWIHNSIDGSAQSAAEVYITYRNGTQTRTFSVTGDAQSYTLPGTSTASYFADGDVILWQVRTKGVMPDWSEYSTQRQITMYTAPSIELTMYGESEWIWDTFNFVNDTIYTAPADPSGPIDTVTTFPFYISATALPATQTAISFIVSITANEGYDTVDNTGVTRRVSIGDEVYKKYVENSGNTITVKVSAGYVDLQNDVDYTLRVVVAMDSGLDAEASYTFHVDWTDDELEPNAEIAIDPDTLSASIRPYCEDDFGNDISAVMLSVYRREFNGALTPVAELLDGADRATVVDPHPSLDFARYRIVAITKSTGAVSFVDLPGVSILHDSIVIQWDDEWVPFDLTSMDDPVDMITSGSMLQLPYNIDISDTFAPDVALVEYIGRESPVSYYGTQKGVATTWNAEIDKNDRETLFAIRRLANWAGDVYVREPSGVGYWANIKPSYNIRHSKATIPVTFNITRVEGGV